ncbi:hypothetical protein VDGL01_03426 [Verticillium dahliae]
MHKNQRHQYACRTCYRTHGVCMYIGLVLMGRALSNESRMRRSSLRQAGTSGRVKMARQATCTIGCRGLRSGLRHAAEGCRLARMALATTALPAQPSSQRDLGGSFFDILVVFLSGGGLDKPRMRPMSAVTAA